MGELAPGHLIILAIVVLLVFGSKRLPEIARGVGEGVRGFRDGITGAADEAPPAPAVLDQPASPVTEASASSVEPAGTNSSPTGPA
jgi:sec-independent protein translocase protein TatA